jgi:hypothetical protein
MSKITESEINSALNSLNNESTNLIVNPTFVLRKVDYESIKSKIVQKDYTDFYNISELNFKNPLNNFNFNYTSTQNQIGFSILKNKTLIKVLGRNKSYNICSNCRLDYTGYHGFGIPYKIMGYSANTGESYNNVCVILVAGETCSLECSYSYYLKMGVYKTSLNPKYLDSESLIRFAFNTLFPNTKLIAAPELTELVPFGDLSISDFRKRLHMIKKE